MTILDVLKTIVYYILCFIVLWCIICGNIVGIVATYYEYKLWKAKGVTSMTLWGCFKKWLFNVLTFFNSCIAAVFVILLYIVTFGNRTYVATICNNYIEVWIGHITFNCLVGKVVLKNVDKLPSSDVIPAPIYIANHGTQIDSALGYYIQRRFKWITKSSVLWMPGTGQILYFGNHVIIRTTGKGRSAQIKALYEESDKALQSGIPMIIYPQGTRKLCNPPLPFKDGAFNISMKNKSLLIPMTYHIPTSNPWNPAYPLSLLWGGSVPIITIEFHDPIQVTGTEDINELKQRCMDIIYSPLPKLPLYVPKNNNNNTSTTTTNTTTNDSDDVKKGK